MLIVRAGVMAGIWPILSPVRLQMWDVTLIVSVRSRVRVRVRSRVSVRVGVRFRVRSRVSVRVRVSVRFRPAVHSHFMRG